MIYVAVRFFKATKLNVRRQPKKTLHTKYWFDLTLSNLNLNLINARAIVGRKENNYHAADQINNEFNFGALGMKV